MSSIKYIVSAVMLSTLAGCSYFSGHSVYNTDKAYKQAKEVHPTQIPDQLDTGIKNTYIVPAAETPVKVAPVSLTPPGSDLAHYEKPKKNVVEKSDQANIPKALASAVSTESQAPASTTSSSSVTSALPVTSNELNVSFSYGQTWEKLGKILPSLGYPIMEQDKSLGIYYIADKANTGGKYTPDTPIYQIHVVQNAASTTISLLNAQNQPASFEVSQRILGELRDKIGAK